MALNQNQFAQTVVKGLLDMKFNPNTISCIVDSSEAGTLVPGQAVTIVDSAGGVPKVIAATADTQDIFGIVNYDIKQSSMAAGDRVEVSILDGNVMWMEASAAIARYAKVMFVISVQIVATASGATKMIVGRALDKAGASGELIRVIIDLPGQTVGAEALAKGAAVADLNQNISPAYVEAEVQAISDKVDELLASLRAANLITT